MPKLAQRVEFLKNGTTITNLETGDKEASYNNTKVVENVKTFVTEQIANGEPGEYYDIHVTVQKQRFKKPV